MLLELVQQLCTAFPMPGNPAFKYTLRAEFITWADGTPAERLTADRLPYARTKAQYSNPVCVWTRATRANFDSTIALAQALAVEFRHRFGKPHGSEAALDWVVRHRAEAQVGWKCSPPEFARDWVFALALPKQYMVDVNEYTFSGTAAVMAYRNYYRAEKRGYWRQPRDPAKPSVWVPAKWTKRDPPEWF
jgi:hypothetical protein